jgi:Family of unknown function (DUF5302)
MATDDPAPEAHPEPDDETRRKFREALARKQEREHLGGTAATTSQHPHAAPAKRSRTFRRKSG